jgi:hypothetical protein
MNVAKETKLYALVVQQSIHRDINYLIRIDNTFMAANSNAR